MADAMVQLIEEAAIPICMVGLLYALPNTQLARRLEKEGRLHPPPLREDLKSADQCTMGSITLRCGRGGRLLTMYAFSSVFTIRPPFRTPAAVGDDARQFQPCATNARENSRRRFGSLEMAHRIITSLPEPRDLFRRTLIQCMSSNPDSIRWIVALTALYIHIGPFSCEVIARLESMMAALDSSRQPLDRAS